jgi:CBS domain-containing protein
VRASDVMVKEVVTVGEEVSVSDLCDILQQAHANGAPVVNADGMLVGVVTEEDILYGSMGSARAASVPDAGAVPEQPSPASDTLVGDIMTSPAVCATEDTDVVELCQLMWQMRIHRIPIVRDGRVTGIVSALDLVRAIAEGRIRVGR